MSDPFAPLTEAVYQAEVVQRAARSYANSMVDLLRDNLRSVAVHRLRRLKAEIAQFNAKTGEWKS
jgi:hypothetical protein